MQEKNDSRIKLVHCIHTTGIGGGIERMDAFYHRYIDRSKFDVMFIVTDEKKDGPGYGVEDEYEYTGLHDRFGKLVSLFAEADIVQFSGGFDPLVCEAARLAEVKVVVELMHLTEAGQLFGNIDVSICVSETVKRLQRDISKSIVVYNGIEIDKFPFHRERGNDGKIIIIESSRRAKPKHFHLDELADEILAIDPRIELWLAGRGHEGEPVPRVKFLGLRADIDSLYRQADFMALFSIEEPFGLVALEAMASGCVSIVSDDGGMGEIVTHKVDGYLADVRAGKGAVVDMIRHAVEVFGSAEHTAVMNSGRKTVEEKFSARKCMGAYEQVYVDLVNKKGRRVNKGPVGMEPSPTALVGDVISFFNMGDWGKVGETVEAMRRSTEPITNAYCASAMETMAAQAMSAGQRAIADTIYAKLIFTSPEDVELVLLRVENLLAMGETAKAVRLLERGVELNPESTELIETLAMLKEKLRV